ncbi:hypothetical protein [Brevundimonas sp.]|uniref:hypothetical protein n=1 Tax=Brevundimonas sp. TaxID=1871086 RepID=UPI0035AF3C23
MNRVEQLEIENEVLRQKLNQLTGGVELEILRGTLGLSGQMAGVLALLLKRPYPVNRDTIYQQVFERPDGSGPIIKTIAVQICKLRARLATAGAPGNIVCAYGTESYALTPDLRAWLKAIVQPMEMAA